MPRALVLGGTGAIGRATARRLLAAGWTVDLTGRDPGISPPTWPPPASASLPSTAAMRLRCDR